MDDSRKTKTALIAELKELRKKLENCTDAGGPAADDDPLPAAGSGHAAAEEIRFRNLVEEFPLAVFETDISGRVLITNKKALDLFGYTETDVQRGFHALEIFAAGEHARAAENINNILHGAEPHANEYTARRKDGSTFPAEIHSSLVIKNGAPAGLRGVIFDLSKRKQAEKALRESEARYAAVFNSSTNSVYTYDKEKYRTIFENTGTAMCIIENDATLSTINREFTVLARQPKEEIEGKAKWTDYVVKEDLERMKSFHRQRRTAADAAPKRYEFSFRDKENGIHNILLTIDMIPDTGQSVASLLDITDHKRIMQNLKTSEERYHTFIKQASEGIYRVEVDPPLDTRLPVEEQIDYLHTRTRIAECNEAFAGMYGAASAEELTGSLPLDLQGDPDNEVNRNEIRAFITSGYRIQDEETREITADGREVWFSNNTMGIVKDGFLVRYWGTQLDITDRKKAEKTLERELKEKTVLLSEIHHRVKNSLQLVASLLRLQSRKIKNRHLLELFNQSRDRIFMMARVYEKLYQSKSYAHINFKEYVKDVLEKRLRASDISGRVRLEITISDVTLGLDDAVPAALIINELFTNSLKHAFPGERKGVIKIRFRKEHDHIFFLLFSDDGIGLPPHVDFHSCDTLGLHLIKALTGQIGGEVICRQDEGTAFEIRFKGYNAEQ